MKIGIILGSVREERFGSAIGQWVFEAAAARNAELYELVDLKDFDLPIYTGNSPRTLGKNYPNAQIQKFSDTIDKFDGFVFVTAEYNYSIPGAFKNAFDSLAPEWQGKPVAFVGYGYTNKGAKAIKAWRQSVEVFQMPQVEAEVTLSLAEDLTDGSLDPKEPTLAALQDVLKQIESAVQN